MNVLTISNLISLMLAVIFVGIAAVHIYSPRFLRDAYQRWGYRNGLIRVFGVLQFISALFLAVPETRLWGGMLAGAITFVAVVILLRHGRYACAIPGMLVLIALPVAMASGLLV